jgi:hypothetical protein
LGAEVAKGGSAEETGVAVRRRSRLLPLARRRKSLAPALARRIKSWLSALVWRKRERGRR